MTENPEVRVVVEKLQCRWILLLTWFLKMCVVTGNYLRKWLGLCFCNDCNQSLGSSTYQAY
jgi:hypothetical protein